MGNDPTRQIYLEAAQRAVGRMPAGNFKAVAITSTAADAAVAADRTRMAEQLRNRIMHSDLFEMDLTGGGEMVAMRVEATMFALAEQIEHGMPPTA